MGHSRWELRHLRARHWFLEMVNQKTGGLNERERPHPSRRAHCADCRDERFPRRWLAGCKLTKVVVSLSLLHPKGSKNISCKVFSTYKNCGYLVNGTKNMTLKLVCFTHFSNISQLQPQCSLTYHRRRVNAKITASKKKYIKGSDRLKHKNQPTVCNKLLKNLPPQKHVLQIHFNCIVMST